MSRRDFILIGTDITCFREIIKTSLMSVALKIVEQYLMRLLAGIDLPRSLKK